MGNRQVRLIQYYMMRIDNKTSFKNYLRKQKLKYTIKGHLRMKNTQCYKNIFF